MDYNNPATRTTTRPMPIGELLDAWLALQAGAFRGGHHPTRPQATQSEDRPWLPCPGEAPVLVVGCAGTVGASTVTLLIASASLRSRVRVVRNACSYRQVKLLASSMLPLPL